MPGIIVVPIRCPSCGDTINRVTDAETREVTYRNTRDGQQHVCLFPNLEQPEPTTTEAPAGASWGDTAISSIEELQRVRDSLMPPVIEYVSEDGTRRRRRTVVRPPRRVVPDAATDAELIEHGLGDVARARAEQRQARARPTLESMGAQASLERLWDAWAVVGVAAIQWAEENDTGPRERRPADAGSQAYAAGVTDAFDVLDRFIRGDGELQRLVDAEVAARERRAQPTPSALDLVNRFVLFLRANPDAVRAVTADDCATRHWVQEWADAEFGAVVAGVLAEPVVTAAVEPDFLNAPHPASPLHGVTEIVRALRRLPAERGTADEQRLHFLLHAYDERLHQIARHGDDVRPEVNECWWVDLLGLYGDKAIDSGRTGAWEDRMADIAALALAAVEWKRRQDGDPALNAQRVVSPPEAEDVHPAGRPDCTRCGGTGSDSVPSGVTRVCPACNGRRTGRQAAYDPPDPCETCDGSGRVDVYGPCPECASVRTEEAVEGMAADLERLLSADVLTGLADDVSGRIEQDEFTARTTGTLQLEGTPWVPEGTFVIDPQNPNQQQFLYSAGQLLTEGSIGAAQVFFVQPDGTRVQVGSTDGPITFTPGPAPRRRSERLTPAERDTVDRLAERLAAAQGMTPSEACARICAVIDRTGYSVADYNAGPLTDLAAGIVGTPQAAETTYTFNGGVESWLR